MRERINEAVTRAWRMYGANPEYARAEAAVAIGRYVYIGPVAEVPADRQRDDKLPPRMVFPVLSMPRERNKYGPKPPAMGARQLARQRLGGFAGRHPEIIRREIEIARHDLEESA
jgi:hypothetical protein